MVVTSQHHATEVGVQILAQGGNAIDAAVAVGYALAVAEPCCGNIGGGGFMLVRFSNDPHNGKWRGKSRFINFREKAPASISTKLFITDDGRVDYTKLYSSYLSVAVPGTVMGLNHALDKYGTMTLPEVMAGAIDLASQGIKVSAAHEKGFTSKLELFSSRPNVGKIFLKNGTPYQEGDTLVQANLAKTLTRIASNGTQAFYKGDIMKSIVRASEAGGGVLTAEDFANYTVEESRPIRCRYHGYDIISAPPPSSGGVTLCQALKILERYPIKQLGFNSAKASHYIIEAVRYAFADRNHYLGDPNFIDNPVKFMLSKDHIDTLRAKIRSDRAGDFRQVCFIKDDRERQQTTHYSIVDEWGNAVSVTYTIDALYGSKLIAGNTGFFLNNEINDFQILRGASNLHALVQGEKNLLQSGKRPLSSMTPTIVMKDGEVRMVVGSPGGPTIITSVLQALINMIDHGMDPKAATDAPRFHTQCTPNRVFIEAKRFDENTRNRLKLMGHKLQMGSIYGRPEWGALAIIERAPDSDRWLGAIDRRRPAGKVDGTL